MFPHNWPRSLCFFLPWASLCSSLSAMSSGEVYRDKTTGTSCFSAAPASSDLWTAFLVLANEAAEILFWKSKQSNLLFYVESVSVFAAEQSFPQGSAVLLFSVVTGMGVKMGKTWGWRRGQQRGSRATEESWGGVAFDATGMSSQAHEHGLNHTWQYRLVCQSQRITAPLPVLTRVFADKALLSRPCCMHNESGRQAWGLAHHRQATNQGLYPHIETEPRTPLSLLGRLHY